ncbi:MAG: circadian clock protein KaiB [Bacteroidetes bacterium]|nr:MAG: circadian clock protein KaiB [Bacteroidota bacterium]
MKDQLRNNAHGRKPSNIFSLYVTGASPNSSRAITNLKNIFERYLGSQYELNIIDVYQQPQLVSKIDIVALPLLVRKMPLPERRLIGDMSDRDKVVRSLELSKVLHERD